MLRGPLVSGLCFAKPPQWTGRNLNRNRGSLNLCLFSPLMLKRVERGLKRGTATLSTTVPSVKLNCDPRAWRGTNHVKGVREPQGRSRSSSCAGNNWKNRVEVGTSTVSNQCIVKRAVFSRFQWFESSF
jgi:hypothetical protein